MGLTLTLTLREKVSDNCLREKVSDNCLRWAIIVSELALRLSSEVQVNKIFSNI